jgi:O-acetyl-ADP-ribose deacetylase (regulator of RNase III)
MKILIGDIFASGAQALVNTVNCVGVMGKGIAAEFKKRYPEMFNQYKTLCDDGGVKPGAPYCYTSSSGTVIINFPTKENWRSPSRLAYIRAGLGWFRENYQSLNIQSVAFPPLGCGNGGLSWEIVGPVMYAYLADLPINITVYAPYGTVSGQLSSEYLHERALSAQNDATGRKNIKINDKWLLILYVIRAVNQSRYVLHVGRVIYQKICYALTRSRVDTCRQTLKMHKNTMVLYIKVP